MACVAVFNQKGGVGKTTTTLNLAAALAREGHAPLALDLDPQAHLTGIGGGHGPAESSLYAFYRNGTSLAALARETPAGWKMIPAHLELSKVDTQYGKGPNILHRLRLGLERERLGATQPVLIDCCPALGVLSISAIFAADLVLVPISADYLAVTGATQVERTLNALQRVLGRRVERRYVITRFDARRRMSHEIHESLRARFGPELCAARISEGVAIAESPCLALDVFAHAPASKGASDYRALFEELHLGGAFGTRPEPIGRSVQELAVA